MWKKKETIVWEMFNKRYWINPPFRKWVQLFVREKRVILRYHWQNYWRKRSDDYKRSDKVWTEYID